MLGLNQGLWCCTGHDEYKRTLSFQYGRSLNFPSGVALVTGCETPCAIEAKKHHMNVAKFCMSQNMPVSYQDGGCKIFNDCASIHCEVCEAADVICLWEKTACVSKYSNCEKD